MNEREAFEQAIVKDKYDEVTRRVYADWLSEHGFDDEATKQYAWTREKQESEDYLREFASKINRKESYGYSEEEIKEIEESESPDYFKPRWTYEEFLEQLADCEDSGNSLFLNFDTPDFMYEEQDKVWEAYRIVMGKTKVKKPKWFVSCGC